MNKSNINELSAGTEADSNSKAENQHVNQPNANTNVVGSLFSQCEIKFIYTVVKPKIVFSSDPITLEEIENGYAKRFLQMNGFLPMSHKVYKRRYIGLKDKNDKEVYEGHILNGGNNVLKIVYWCDKRSAFCESEQFKPIPAKHSFAKLYDKFGKVFNRNGRLENHFIVGDVFENPELLQSVV